MKVNVVLDGLFTLKDNKPASNNMNYLFFERYLSVFDSVRVTARCFQIEDKSADAVEGDRVFFSALPSYRGPAELFKVFLNFMSKFIKCYFDSKHEIAILRLPATIPMIWGVLCILTGRKFFVELVGDPSDAYSKESIKSALSPLYKFIFTKLTKILCRKASGVSYVTKSALQLCYPNKNMFSYTSLALPLENYAISPKLYQNKEEFNLLMVAMMQNYYKGHDIALSAMVILKERGLKANLSLVGSGPLEQDLKAFVEKNQINVSFLGKIPAGVEILQIMRESDLFILPSRQEGLPRVIIEAMSQGLVCVATDVGGTSELVSGAQLVRRNVTPVELADRIMSILGDPGECNKISEDNLERSHLYSDEIVQKSRVSFYEFIKAS